MSFEDYVKEFGLQLEKNVKAEAVDLSKFECSLAKGVLSINPAATKAMGIDKSPYVEIYSGIQGGMPIFGIRREGKNCKDNKTVHKVKVLKTKPTKINLAYLFPKYKLSLSKEYKIDLIDCSDGYLVFAVIIPFEPKKEEVAPKVEKEEKKYYSSGIIGAQESVMPGSDF